MCIAWIFVADRSIWIVRVASVLTLIAVYFLEHRDAYITELTALGLLGITLVVHRTRDRILRALSFGSFGPSTIFARKTAAADPAPRATRS